MFSEGIEREQWHEMVKKGESQHYFAFLPFMFDLLMTEDRKEAFSQLGDS